MTKECACEVYRDNKVYHDTIVYCPLHAKAPEMREFIAKIACSGCEDGLDTEVDEARALLREIEEG